MPDWARALAAALFDAGWLLPGNPPEYGGRNATLPQLLAHQEELSQRQIYHSFNPQGLGIIAASLLTFGTEEQKQRWAVPLLRAEITASLGMSEPGAGSDLAGLQHPRRRRRRPFRRQRAEGVDLGRARRGRAADLRAHRPGRAQAPGHQRAADPDRHRGRDLRGRSRRIAGPDDLDFNEVFFTDVRVPEENLVGELNQGWTVAHGSLGHERTMLWLNYAERLDDLIRDAPSDQEWFATLHMDVPGAAAARLPPAQRRPGSGRVVGAQAARLRGRAGARPCTRWRSAARRP